MLPVPTMATTL